MKINNSYSPINQDDLVRVERLIGFELPQAYKSFLLIHNGGRPLLDGVSYKGEHFDFLGHLYAVRGESYHDDLIRNIKQYKELIPSGYLPIGESPGGDVFCISMKEPNLGAVFHWDHEEANYDGVPWEYNMTNISPSLEEFLESLNEGV